MTKDDLGKYLAEFAGTFVLIFFATGSVVVSSAAGLGAQPILFGMSSGLALMIVIWTFAGTSGAHVNPALSLCFALLGRLPVRLLAGYVLAQFAGSALASLALRSMLGLHAGMGATFPNQPLGVSAFTALAGEILLSIIMMLVILGSAGATAKFTPTSAVPVGAVVGLEVMIMGPVTGAAMNPARAFGPCVVTGDWQYFWIYAVGSSVGIMLGGLGFARVNRWTLDRISDETTARSKST